MWQQKGVLALRRCHNKRPGENECTTLKHRICRESFLHFTKIDTVTRAIFLSSYQALRLLRPFLWAQSCGTFSLALGLSLQSYKESRYFCVVLTGLLVCSLSLQGAKWELFGEDEPRVRFWGSSVDLHLNWTDVLTFSDGDTYSWRKVRCPQGACACLPHTSFCQHLVRLLARVGGARSTCPSGIK